MIKSDSDEKCKNGFASLFEVIENGMSICYNAGHENQQPKSELQDAKMRIDTLHACLISQNETIAILTKQSLTSRPEPKAKKRTAKDPTPFNADQPNV
jgi:hypothetical protein